MRLNNKVLGVFAGLMLYAGVQTVGNVAQKHTPQKPQIVQTTQQNKNSIDDLIDFLVPNAYAGETVKEITIDGKTYGIDYVNNVISKNQRKELSVKNYLKEESIEEITLDNYKQKVYGSDKPVIVMPYCNDDFEGVDMREAIILKFLRDKYIDKINFYAFDASDDKPKELFVKELVKFSTDKVYSKYPIDRVNWSIPSLILYSPFDILRGETPENNDGNIKIVDVMGGGVGENWKVVALTSWLMKNWISTNLHKKGFVYRFFNAYTPKKYSY